MENAIMEFIVKYEEDPRNHEFVFILSYLLYPSSISYEFDDMCRKNMFKEYFIQHFIDAISDKNYKCHYVRLLLESYGAYLRDGIALVSFTNRKLDRLLIKRWCANLLIDYNKEKVTKFVEEYCITHDEIVPEDDPCPYYYKEDNCDIEYDYYFKETKIILCDDNHIGTFEELDFEWDNRYVNGGYTVKR